MHNATITHLYRDTLAQLRALVPRRAGNLTYRDALRIADRQAEELHRLTGIVDGPVPQTTITNVPNLHIELVDGPVSSLRFWDQTHGYWVIQLAASDPPSTRRFNLAYEFKHILDYSRRHYLYRGDEEHTTNCQAERAARHFAGCLLVPSLSLAHKWACGVRDTAALAEYFSVDPVVIDARLAQIGLGSTSTATRGSVPVIPIPHPRRKECRLNRSSSTAQLAAFSMPTLRADSPIAVRDRKDAGS
jgi:hypothetical protein